MPTFKITKTGIVAPSFTGSLAGTATSASRAESAASADHATMATTASYALKADSATSASMAESASIADYVTYNNNTTARTSGRVALAAGKYTVIETVTAALTFTIANVGAAYEHRGRFTMGSTVYSVTFPSTVVWAAGKPTIRANHTYEFSIINNLGVLVEF